MKQFWILCGLVAGALVLGGLIVYGRDLFVGTPHAVAPAQTEGKLPWQIRTTGDGRSVALGLTLAPDAAQASTLGDARGLWGPDPQIAIIAAPGEDGTLEAFVDPAQAGFIAGKVVITADLPADVVRGMRERAIKSEFMESTTRKYTLAPADLDTALKAPISALAFIPQANLDADTVIARFGTPAERLRSNGHLEHFLYPDKGLDLALDTEGKELLQYVAPARFEARLRAPLLAAIKAAAAAAVSASQPTPAGAQP